MNQFNSISRINITQEFLFKFFIFKFRAVFEYFEETWIIRKVFGFLALSNEKGG